MFVGHLCSQVNRQASPSDNDWQKFLWSDQSETHQTKFTYRVDFLHCNKCSDTDSTWLISEAVNPLLSQHILNTVITKSHCHETLLQCMMYVGFTCTCTVQFSWLQIIYFLFSNFCQVACWIGKAGVPFVHCHERRLITSVCVCVCVSVFKWQPMTLITPKIHYQHHFLCAGLLSTSWHFALSKMS